ncbi:hypothetical protein K437DRAFT_255884 [Tilletiaria anomala UBC 951]|uniref:Uncharacterized protein n=1 Tax=Tilletiaria anomala (strain ATCC 24038 / CBS 436.72 / UBC 951) TaxID=1037660 RepID=A0A066W084_TILAU|nr:uncharacterized protein K437DRAFT_255884 [Tilletiaria anomala UBC 951]KDN47342.1 hypothetical protein K437DRAFT_255884 [Tilletiaria anomala UBC 951]
MGVVFSCFASVFMYTGELLEHALLAIGEIGSILIRGLFAILVGLCDILAAISCCCTVPWSQRPDRTGFSADTLSADVGRGGVFASFCTSQGRVRRQEQKLAKKKEQDLKAGAAANEKLEREKAKQQTKMQAKEKKLADKAEKTKEAAPPSKTEK